MKHFIISLSVFLLLSCSGESEPVSVQIDEAIQLDQSSESDRLNQWFAEKNEERLAFSPIELKQVHFRRSRTAIKKRLGKL